MILQLGVPSRRRVDEDGVRKIESLSATEENKAISTLAITLPQVACFYLTYRLS